MNELWVLSVRTSLPDVCETPEDMKINFYAFDSFEKGREAMRKTIKEYAFSENSMFDGKGNIIHLQNYLEGYDDEEFIDDGEILDKNRLTYVCDALKNAFDGKDEEFGMESERCTDWMITVETVDDTMYMFGDCEGPINGYNPHISTNMFTMNEEKHYFLYIDDMFGQGASSELYIDLKKVEVK